MFEVLVAWRDPTPQIEEECRWYSLIKKGPQYEVEFQDSIAPASHLTDKVRPVTELYQDSAELGQPMKCLWKDNIKDSVVSLDASTFELHPQV